VRHSERENPTPADGSVTSKPTSEEICLEAEKLRDTAVKLIQHAATLIARAADLEKQIAGRDKLKPHRKA
jgi:hypothetical protein